MSDLPDDVIAGGLSPGSSAGDNPDAIGLSDIQFPSLNVNQGSSHNFWGDLSSNLLNQAKGVLGFGGPVTGVVSKMITGNSDLASSLESRLILVVTGLFLLLGAFLVLAGQAAGTVARSDTARNLATGAAIVSGG